MTSLHYSVNTDMTPGDRRRGRQHHNAITIITPLSPVPMNPAEMANKMMADADFVVESAIGTMMSHLDNRKVTKAQLAYYKSVILKNLRQKIVQRCDTPGGAWHRV